MSLHRTQILLEEEQYHRLKALAAQEGIPLSALVRRMLNERMGDLPRRDHGRRLRELAGIASSGQDVVDHDEILYEKDWE